MTQALSVRHSSVWRVDMGLFDKIKSFVNSGELDRLTETVGKTVNTFLNEQAAAAQNHSAPSANQNSNAPSDLLATANIPPKPDFTVNGDNGNKKYSFQLSGDFIEFSSHCEFIPSYQYEPLSSNDYTEYDGSLPIIAIGPGKIIHNAAESFEKGEAVTNITVTTCDSPYFLFSASFKEYDKKYYAYAFAKNTAREHEMLCVQYDPKLSGTALEKKLIAAVDKAAATYKETNI